MEKFRNQCASLCSSFSKQSRLYFAIVSTLLASICFLSLGFSPSFLTLLLLIPSIILFLANQKSDLNPISNHNDHKLFDEMPQTTAEQLSSDYESSSNNGGDFESDLWMYCFDELARNLPFSDDSSSEDDDCLIEIPLRPNLNAIRNLDPDLLPKDSVLKQQRFVEEINEEDNLIEIDISRGFNQFSTDCN